MGAFAAARAARRERLRGRAGSASRPACPSPWPGARPPGAARHGPREAARAVPAVLGEIEARVLQAKSLDVQTGTIGVKPLDLELATALRRALIGWGLEGSERGGKGFCKCGVRGVGGAVPPSRIPSVCRASKLPHPERSKDKLPLPPQNNHLVT